MSIPSLAALALRTDAPKHRADASEPSQRKKPKNDDNTLYFVSKHGGPNRKLSNLFGGVEWAFQRAKFEDGSVVAKFLDRGRKKEMNGKYTNEEFKAQFAALYPDGKATTYIKPDGTAFGMLAKLVGGICKQPGCGRNDTGFSRLKKLLKNENHVFFGPGEDGEDGDGSNNNNRMTYSDFQNWQQANVKCELTQPEKEALLLKLNEEKYEDPLYRELLLSTGDKALHEEPSRAVSIDAYNYATDNGYARLKDYEEHRRSIINRVKNEESLSEADGEFWWKRYHEELNDAVPKILAECQEGRYVNDGSPAWRGGDMTGRVLMRVRGEIRAGTASQIGRPSCSTDPL